MRIIGYEIIQNIMLNQHIIFLTDSYYRAKVMQIKGVAISDREVQTLRFLGGRNYAYTVKSLISMYF